MTGLVESLRQNIPAVAFTIWVFAAAALFGYLVGSVNPAAIIARLRGADLRRSGSGNPGATNAGRIMGWRVGVVVALLDMVKGAVAVLAIDFSSGHDAALVAGFMSVVGHVTSPFLRGRGGKGVATAFGAVVAVHPLWALPISVVFVVVLLVSRNVGLSSVCAAIALVPTAVLLDYGWPDVGFAVAIALLVSLRHWSNLLRIVRALRLHQGIPRG